MLLYNYEKLFRQQYILNNILKKITPGDVFVEETNRDIPYNKYKINKNSIGIIFSPVYDNIYKQYITQVIIGRHYNFDKDSVTINIPNTKFLEQLKQLSYQQQASQDLNNHNRFELLATEFQRTK